MTLALLSAGFDLAVCLFHITFWRLFGWPGRLAPAGRLNAAVTQTLNIMLAYVFFATAAGIAWAVLTGHPPEAVLWAATGFWLLRMTLQPALFPLSSRVNVAVTAVWLLGAAIHAGAVLTSP